MMTVPWVHVFVDVPEEQVDQAQQFWSAATGTELTSPWNGHPEFVSLQPPSGDPYVHVQRIGGSARVHVDLLTDAIDADADRLEYLGAERVERHRWWQVMRSPSGLPFCLCGDPGRERPGPMTWPGGHRSRIAQVCVDIPSSAFVAEVQFWTAATGWRVEQSKRAEFTSLVPPETSPVKFLFQRLGPDDPRTQTTAHIDLGTDDIPAEVTRLLGCGAQDVDQPADVGRWHVLEDPAGLPFCVTPQPPD